MSEPLLSILPLPGVPGQHPPAGARRARRPCSRGIPPVVPRSVPRCSEGAGPVVDPPRDAIMRPRRCHPGRFHRGLLFAHALAEAVAKEFEANARTGLVPAFRARLPCLAAFIVNTLSLTPLSAAARLIVRSSMSFLVSLNVRIAVPLKLHMNAVSGTYACRSDTRRRHPRGDLPLGCNRDALAGGLERNASKSLGKVWRPNF